MNLQDLLNTDLKVVGRWLKQGLAWWLEELAGMTPALGRKQNSHDTLAEPVEDGAYRLSRDGELLDMVRTAGRLRAVTLLLSPEDVLLRRLELPLLPAKDTRRMLALDIDRLTPFRSDQVFFDAEVLASDEARRRQSVLLGAVRRQTAIDAVERAAGLGLSAQRLAVHASGAPPHLDFLQTMRAGGAAVSRDRRPIYWWTSVAALMALNVVLLVVRDATDVSRLRNLVQSQRTTAGVALRLRQQVIEEAWARTDQVERQRRTEPLRVLDAITAALPRGTWVQRLEYNGRSVHLIGYKPPDFDILTALRASPMLANARSMATDAPARVASNQPYELAADVRATPAPPVRP